MERKRMDKRLGRAAAAIATLCVVDTPAQAYRIKMLGAQHEIMAVRAEQCLMDLGDRVLEERCTWPQTVKQFDAIPYTANHWGDPVRWPDDPRRQVYSVHGLKVLYRLEFGGCKRRLAETDDADLLCESHFRRFQFFHAMKVPSDDDAQTRAKILSWTGFSFDVATDRVEGSAPLCEAVKSYPGLAGSFATSCLPNGTMREWKIADLFASTCRRTCELPQNADALTRASALGAIIHLVQDSFSQAHTARGGVFSAGPYSARIVCLPVQRFYSYDEAQAKIHGSGDGTPMFDEECRFSAIVDPITASARLMWLWRNNCQSSWAVELIDRAVLGSSQVARVPSSPEQCRVPTTVA